MEILLMENNQTFYCHEVFHELEKRNYFMHIKSHPILTKMYGDEPVIEVIVSETNVDDENTYYGWKKPDGKFNMIYPQKFLVEMCFPYGLKLAEKNNEGKFVLLNIKVKK
jgi:hypothetical protein